MPAIVSIIICTCHVCENGQSRRDSALVRTNNHLSHARSEMTADMDAEPKTNWQRILFWVSVLVLIILLPFLIDDPVCFYTYLNTKTFESVSFVRIGHMTFREKDDPATLLEHCRAQGWLRPGETVQQERLPEYWICTHMQPYTLLGSPIFHEVRGGKYPVKLRYFLMEHCQEMLDPDYKETEEEFSTRFTEYILSLNGDEKFKGALLPADTDLRARSH